MMSFDGWKTRHLSFLKDESGAITVDWVVLTAAVCGMVMLVFTQVTPLVFEEGAQAIAAEIESVAVRD